MFRAEEKPGTAAIALSGLQPVPLELSEADRLPQFTGVSDSGNLFLPRDPHLSLSPPDPHLMKPRCPPALSNNRRSCLYRDHDALRSMDLIGASANRLTRYRTSPSFCSVRRARDDQPSVTSHALVLRQLPEALAAWAD
jgi:hypothetical protein